MKHQVGNMFVEESNNNTEWEVFLKASPDGTPYHSQKWKEVIQRLFPYDPLYLTIRDSNGRLVGISPAFITGTKQTKIYDSMPHSDYGGPLIAQHCLSHASECLASFIKNFCTDKGIAYARICLMDDQLARHFNLCPRCADKSVGIMEIDLKAKPSDFIWKRIFSRHERKKIRLVERDGFQAQEARTKSDLRDFYSLYSQDMKYIGVSPSKYEYMENLWDALYPENLRIWIVGKNRKIGGIAVLKYGRKTYWISVGIDRKYSGNYSLVPYLVWKEIKKAEEEGYAYVSLGSTPANPRHPSRIQKMSFGGSFHQQKTILWPFNSTASVLLHSKAAILPAWLAFRIFLPHKFKRFVARTRMPMRSLD